jgi:hypothetical protein
MVQKPPKANNPELDFAPGFDRRVVIFPNPIA